MIICLYSGNVAGVSHSKPDFNKLAPRDVVTLVPEPQNEYDAQAIRVDHATAGKLGYIPRDSTYGFHVNKSTGVPCETFILSLNETKKTIQIAAFCDSSEFPA